ncbi:lipid-binding SYLF domain-containing protein [Sabulicella rubraurantiaca]|uniref:hypothetical protein n=1 Tax=Sabulicella rubraurantiaca TaxID=2811429 RepID=UPI001A96D631|nr:hypothetical protein [Sabulicella rubraurantiaca]
MSPLSRRALPALLSGLCLAPIAPRAAAADDGALALLDRLREGPAAGLTREAHAALLFPRITRSGFTIAGQHAEGTCIGPDGPLGRFGLSAPPFAVLGEEDSAALAVLFMTEGALQPLLNAGMWHFGAPTAGTVLALRVTDRDIASLPTPEGARLFRLSHPRRDVTAST